jgi:hypothetical protein|tara:strand:+ start:445 stop:774 length:330 start_codon:yes stop_codon:yes gene_type:complete
MVVLFLCLCQVMDLDPMRLRLAMLGVSAAASTRSSEEKAFALTRQMYQKKESSLIGTIGTGSLLMGAAVVGVAAALGANSAAGAGMTPALDSMQSFEGSADDGEVNLRA